MLVSYERSLKERHPFTSDHGRIAEELYELEELTGLAARTESDRRQLLDAIYEEANPDPRDHVIARASHYAQSLFNDLQFTLDALKELVDSLAGLPGRKAILYLSDGLAMRAAEDVFFALQERWEDSRFLLEAHRYDVSDRFEELAAQANAHRVTFYAVDAAGLRTHSYNNAENSGPTGGVAIDETHFANLQTPLQLLAGETGGLAIVNTNRFAPQLARIADDFGSYYSLGFTPAPGNRRYRRIEVAVRGRKGITVRHREGFRDKPPAARMTEGTLAALHYGYEQNELGVEVEFGPATPSQRDLYSVPVVVKVPIAALELVPGDGVARGQLRLYVAVRDSDGALSPVQEVPVTVEIPAGEIERARRHVYHHEITLLMRSGRQLLAVGARDEVGAVSSFVTRGAEIGR